MNSVENLAEKLKKQDERAFEQIVDKFTGYAAAVINNTAKGSLSKEDIEEAVMDTFVTLWRNADKVQKDKLKGYIACIAKSKAKNKLAALKLIEVIDIQEIDVQDSFTITDETESKDLEKDILHILDGFKKQDKEIFIRHYFYYQKLADIADNLSMTQENVKVRLFRTRNKLKQALVERGYII